MKANIAQALYDIVQGVLNNNLNVYKYSTSTPWHTKESCSEQVLYYIISGAAKIHYICTNMVKLHFTPSRLQTECCETESNILQGLNDIFTGAADCNPSIYTYCRTVSAPGAPRK